MLTHNDRPRDMQSAQRSKSMPLASNYNLSTSRHAIYMEDNNKPCLQCYDSQVSSTLHFCTIPRSCEALLEREIKGKTILNQEKCGKGHSLLYRGHVRFGLSIVENNAKAENALGS